MSSAAPSIRLPVTVGTVLLHSCLLLLAVSGLWLLHVFGRVMSDTALLGVWLLLSALSAAALFWRARARRRIILHAYLAQESFLQRWLRGGLLMLIRESVLAAVLALILTVVLLRAEDHRLWYVLIAGAPGLIVLQYLLRAALQRQLAGNYQPVLIWLLSSRLLGAVMLGALVSLALFRNYPDFTGVSLERAVWHMADQESARSACLNNLLQLAAAIDGLRLWLAQQLLPLPGVSWLLQLSGWIIVFAQEMLFVWSYLLICQGVIMVSSLGISGNTQDNVP